MGAGGPGGWWALNPESRKSLILNSAASLSMDDASGSASLKYEWAAEIAE